MLLDPSETGVIFSHRIMVSLYSNYINPLLKLLYARLVQGEAEGNPERNSLVEGLQAGIVLSTVDIKLKTKSLPLSPGPS